MTLPKPLTLKWFWKILQIKKPENSVSKRSVHKQFVCNCLNLYYTKFKTPIFNYQFSNWAPQFLAPALPKWIFKMNFHPLNCNKGVKFCQIHIHLENSRSRLLWKCSLYDTLVKYGWWGLGCWLLCCADLHACVCCSTLGTDQWKFIHIKILALGSLLPLN